MKDNKQNKLQIIILIFIATISLFTFSCSQEPIFATIAQEIPLSDPTVQGNVFSIVPLNGKLYVQNGAIYSQPFSANRQWTEINLPSSSNIIRLASDENYLYSMDNNYKIFAKNITSTPEGNWEEITTGATGTYTIALFDNGVYDNKTGKTTGRNAYITISTTADGTTKYAVKKLSGTTVTNQGNTTAILSAAKGTSGDVFSTSSMLVSYFATGTRYFYTVNEKQISYSTDGSPWTNGGTVEAKALSLSISPNGKTLYIGTEEGYEISSIDDSGVPSSGTTPTSNAESAFGTRQVCGIWSYSNMLYASVISRTTSAYNQLWGCSTASDSKWDYE